MIDFWSSWIMLLYIDLVCTPCHAHRPLASSENFDWCLLHDWQLTAILQNDFLGRLLLIVALQAQPRLVAVLVLLDHFTQKGYVANGQFECINLGWKNKWVPFCELIKYEYWVNKLIIHSRNWLFHCGN